MKRILCLIATILAVSVAHGYTTSTQLPNTSLTAGRDQLEIFRRQASAGQPNATGYQALYTAAQSYMDAIDHAEYASPEFMECRQALLEIFPQIAQGAYYFASLNDRDKVLEYACSYVDISLLNCMESQQLQSSPQYSTLANLAATNLYNRRQYDRSIKYFSAYLESGDLTAQENAFEGLARCYFETKQYGSAAGICVLGSERYPRNINILLIGIESCGYNGNDTEMEPMLQKALTLQPDHKGLLEYQGKMFERTNRYEDAAKSYTRLCSLNPSNLDYTCHLGFNYYNAATLASTIARTKGTSSENALRLYRLATPHLKAVLDNSPYAANVARALAFCYSQTNDAIKLSEANKALSSLHSQPVDLKAIPTLVQNYNPSPEIAPVSAATTTAIANGENNFVSDVDYNIPETGISNPDTYVVIIANENYQTTDPVPYAHNDGEMFREYCQKVLGVEKDHIWMHKDATAYHMRSEVKRLSERTDIDPGKLNIIFYYAGHGNPDIVHNKSYLVPVDVRADDFEECYALDKLYDQLDAMKARNVTVFLDACFSGGGRTDKNVVPGRYVRKNQADVKPSGKTIVFSASSADEAAKPYNAQRHGYFTYFLLKALQETRGHITYAALRDYLGKQVQATALDLENAHQTPSFACPDALVPTLATRKLID